MVEIDDHPTRRSGPRRVYGSTKAQAALLADVAGRGGLPAGPVGRTLAGRYEIDALVGRRFGGTAYRARDLAAAGVAGPSRVFCVTLLDDEVARLPDLAARVRRAATTVRQLRQPALDTPEQVVEADGTVLLVSTHRTGRLLSDLLARTAGAVWPLRSVMPVGYRIADALAPAHLLGLAHGALGAGSVVLTPDDGVIVLDMALRLALADPPADPADDVLGLASLLLALLSGDAAGRPGTVAPKRPPGLGPPAWAGLLAGLAADRALRPPTLEALIVSLEDPGWFRRLVGRRSR